ncbi:MULTISPECIES: NADH-quinone oxidoreductase subunit C [unclassified Paracoccus (in: a-proteobacteria)]|uniref:NADH-quinone oxidoreductase subunit C n=1 Tax=unclassified Paracoccus (in: a-proteobacteria) TaxID=2688777 RepID=UPI0012B1DA44|nr:MULTISPECIES: NADH-quinone oxidoreductase subunit C [unclassified Paracoccus (in: a-proteobacteria)]UXU75219.1 NADH-quinone oxidoreductase subunit C [Paracoccus sp. SMMA_5]UXU81121.1 NADH-quinone oxidoreductase subunit C [Paracoccus sp. SMMA_5_TC]
MSDETLLELAEHISLRRENDVVSTQVAFGELTVQATLSGVIDLIEFLRNDGNCRFSTLIDITAVDNPARPARFDVVYHLLSMYQNQRIRVKVQVREDEVVPSLTGVFPGAGWYEREVFDMFGILFSGHADLRRILTDYGFRGHPLRKDFPTTGYTEVRWNDLEKRVVYEPVKLVQEYRQFDFLSPWEGAKYVLPGDEKGGAR